MIKNVNLIFLSTMIGSTNFLNPVLTLFFLNRGTDESHIFFVMLSFSLTVLFMEIPTGVFADRFGPKSSLILGAVIRGVAAILLWHAHTPWHFYLSRALDGLGYCFFSGALEALVFESLKRENRENDAGLVFSKLQTATYIPLILANIFGSIVVKDLTSQQFTYIAGLWAIACSSQLIPLVFLKDIRPTENKKKTRYLEHVGDAFKDIKSSPNLISLFMNFTLVFITCIIFTRFQEVALIFSGLQPALLGVFSTVALLLCLFVTRSMERLKKRYSYPQLFFISGMAITIGIAMCAFFPKSVHAVVIGAVFVAVGSAVRWPVYVHLRNGFLFSERRATSISILSVFDSVLDLLILGSLGLVAHITTGQILFSILLIGLAGLLLFRSKQSEVAN